MISSVFFFTNGRELRSRILFLALLQKTTEISREGKLGSGDLTARIHETSESPLECSKCRISKCRISIVQVRKSRFSQPLYQ
jgi:hypothetical protein